MILAERTLDKDGRPIGIRIFQPLQQDGHWTCRFEIDWPEGMKAMEASGADSVQALLIALQMIGGSLYASGHHESGELSWPGWKGGYGFPVPVSLRDELTGEDKLYV